tara:strand:- start:571 stop:864 length:294 start_codon:yes stop_codon:yes gene_type:complete
LKVVFEEDVVAVVGVRALDVIVALVTVYILFFFLLVCYPKLFSVVVTHLSLKKQAKKKTKNERKKRKKSKHVTKKRAFAKKKHKESKTRETTSYVRI